MRHEEVRLCIHVKHLKVLIAAVHGRARVHARYSVKEFIAAFDRSLYQRAGNPGGALVAGGAALACAGLSILLVLGSLAATKGTARLTKKILLGIKALFVGKETVG